MDDKLICAIEDVLIEGGCTGSYELAQAALAAIRDSGHVILPNDWIRRKMPRIDPGGGGLLNEVPLDEEVHCCQWTLYQERERVNAEFDKLVGIEPPAAALVGRKDEPT